LEHRASELEAVAGLRFEIDASERLPALDAPAEEAAYLVTVEAMANAARHAGASQCHVEISSVNGQLQVAVTDDGSGPGQTHHDGNGLRSARERTEACGGTLQFGANERGGTRLLLTLPGWTKL
ncbi:MAG TPA: ATP-binding protein, partial [Humibacillus sp.]|nr:ATP-binding protein [Humibacillus sp.]